MRCGWVLGNRLDKGGWDGRKEKGDGVLGVGSGVERSNLEFGLGWRYGE